jgi:serine protease Do
MITSSGPGGPTGIDDLIDHIVQTVGPATVGIRTRGSAGSGVVVAEGVVLTNAHNLRGEELAVHLPDGTERTGEALAVDADADLALIGVDTADLTVAQWPEDGTSVKLGSVVVALANPGGRGLRATYGTVSALEQAFRGPRGRRITGGVEHTAPLQRGSSGGPVVDREGRLVGINTNRLGDGFYLAIPADSELRKAIEDLRTGSTTPRVRLGVAIAPTAVARRLRAAVGLPERDGLLVHSVVDDSPASAAGLRQGDLLVRAGDTELASVDDLHLVLDGQQPGDTLPIGLVRGVEETSVEVRFPSS